jgi:hypothetical protein
MLEEADILARRRAETLSLPEWIILTGQHDKMKTNQRKQKG